MKATSQIEIDCPAQDIDLALWLSTMSDGDYQGCSRAHRAAGTFREGGSFGMVNVESVGGHLLVQHYLAAQATPRHVVMHSKRSRVYVMHLAPAAIEVIWTLTVEPRTDHSCVLHCTVETRIWQPLGFIATLALLPIFLRQHVREETPGFARDIARKVSEGRFKAAPAVLAS